MGTSSHLRAARALRKFHPSATIRLLGDINPWRTGTWGTRCFDEILRPQPVITVHEFQNLLIQLGIPDNFDQGHLRWLFTWHKHAAFPFISVDEKLYDPKETYVAAERPALVTPPAPPAPHMPAMTPEADIAQRVAAVAQSLQVATNALTELARLIGSTQGSPSIS